MEQQHKITNLSDYRKPDFFIPKVELHFDIFDEKTKVTSLLTIGRNPSEELRDKPLILNGERLKLISVKLNDQVLTSDQYQTSDYELTIPNVPDLFTLQIENEIKPHENLALEGLYASGNIFCTQNEPEGFRKITYFLDRPDVMSKYTVTICADQTKYPVLLSNGNEVGRGSLDQGRHFVQWEDPFKKPCYLFALVAGDLGMIESFFTTKSKRKIKLRIYVDKGNEAKAIYAMKCLKQAMKWDEKEYGLECDLDMYMIVAVDAFNQGAMENKGLNIFNTQYVIADPKTATDNDFNHIQSVIGHEYFHNWTGNRVTCRDWFQLSLKEGLTVFRDQEFSADMTSRAVCRIDAVRTLKNAQFAEDSGPNAHSVRPKSYMEINNFYTPTIYEKGAEIYRMIQNLIGTPAFQKGIKKYFELFDGQAVTLDDFLYAMEQASGVDLNQFKNWFDQAGTPVCNVSSQYNAKQKTLRLTVSQNCPKLAEEKTKKPFYFPLKVGFIGKKGQDLNFDYQTKERVKDQKTAVLHIKKPKEVFEFKPLKEKPVLSLLRDFSAPVKLNYEYTTDELIFLMEHDSNGFNRFEAAQRLQYLGLKKMMGQLKLNKKVSIDSKIIKAFGSVLHDPTLDSALAAETLSLPSVALLIEGMKNADFDSAEAARNVFYETIGKKFESKILNQYTKLHKVSKTALDAISIGKRSYKNTLLYYLIATGKRKYSQLAFQQFILAKNMTDQIAALSFLCHVDGEERVKAIEHFRDKWKDNKLVLDKWFAAQAVARRATILSEIKKLELDPLFDRKNPNKIRALYGSFASNLPRFHDQTGKGYEFMVNKIMEIDSFNGHIAARLATCFKKYGVLDSQRKKLMKEQLLRILHSKSISKSVYEIISKTLQ